MVAFPQKYESAHYSFAKHDVHNITEMLRKTINEHSESKLCIE